MFCTKIATDELIWQYYVRSIMTCNHSECHDKVPQITITKIMIVNEPHELLLSKFP